MVKSEKQFAHFLESQGKTYVPQPRTFKYNGKSYRPDFYCMQDDTYYEVKTQLLFSEAVRLLEFKKFYPYVKLKIVAPNGYPYYSRTTAKALEVIEDKLNFLKSRDILEISPKEFQKNLKEFHVIEKKTPGNSLRSFSGSTGSIENIKRLDKAKKQLGIK